MTNPTPRALVPVTPTKEMSEELSAYNIQYVGEQVWDRTLAKAPHSGAVSNGEVERAARAQSAFEHMGDTDPWEMDGEETREYWRKHVRTAFRAIGLEVEG